GPDEVEPESEKAPSTATENIGATRCFGASTVPKGHSAVTETKKDKYRGRCGLECTCRDEDSQVQCLETIGTSTGGIGGAFADAIWSENDYGLPTEPNTDQTRSEVAHVSAPNTIDSEVTISEK
ncbi:hypothetical protein F444_03164, partial [Phytophthora nicotianae P1976]